VEPRIFNTKNQAVATATVGSNGLIYQEGGRKWMCSQGLTLKFDPRDQTRVGGKCVHAFSLPDVPDLSGIILGARRHRIPVEKNVTSSSRVL